MERVLAFLDSIFHVPSTIVDFYHLGHRKPRIRENESDPWKEFPRVPLNLGNHSALSVPRTCLIPKVNQLDLNPTLGRPSHRSSSKLTLCTTGRICYLFQMKLAHETSQLNRWHMVWGLVKAFQSFVTVSLTPLTKS